MVSREENMEELIGKFLAGEATPEEAISLEDWKEENPDNLLIYNKCKHLFDTKNSVGLLCEPNLAAAWKHVQRATVETVRTKSMWSNSFALKIAASLVILLGVGLAVSLLVNRSNGGEVVIASGASETAVKLEDNTDVKVFAHSSVVLSKGYGVTNRRLRLKGSASFEVVHKEEIPFVIDAGNVFIEDIGTKFSVTTSENQDTVHVKVDEGVVLLFDSIGSAVEIRATERALYIKSRKQIITPKGAMPSASKLVFANTTLGEVIVQLSRSYKTEITLENSNLANCAITTQFLNENLETVLTIITETLGLSFEKRLDSYIIKGKQCK